jgi:hypothetical protein
MDSPEVMEHEMQRYRVGYVLHLFSKAIGKAGKPAYRHSHSEVLSLGIAGGDMLAVGVAA